MANPTLPTADLVRKACDQFDKEDAVVEAALAELFGQYPTNTNPGHVLLKVTVLNSLYFANIRSISGIRKVADHISKIGEEVDVALRTGSPEIVHKIAKVQLGEKTFTFYSFASKFCNWHQPSLFPIYDSRVEEYLWSLKNSGIFSPQEFAHRSSLWDYPNFLRIMKAFLEQFNLSQFSFKEIDKFLYTYGGPYSLPDAQAQSEADELKPRPTTEHADEGVDLFEIAHQEILDNPTANRLADEAAAEQARKLGISEESIKHLI